jgi:hypothetical protein
MKNYTTFGILIGALLMISACTQKEQENTTIKDTSPTLVEIEAVYDAGDESHLFKTDADTISAGWTTVRLKNASPMVHFALIEQLPGDRTSEDMHAEVLPVFQDASYLLEEGKPDEAMAAFGNLPAWFNEVVWMGGPGFLSPGLISEATLFLPPGNYQVECYVKNEDGTYHWNMGMYFDLHVTQDTTNAQPPQQVDVTVTTTDQGLQIEGSPQPGENLVAVNFNEVEPALLGRDVHVIEVTDETDPNEVYHWMDFNLAGSLTSSSEYPAPVVFMGGTHDMPRGNTAYFTFNMLEGKDYAWVTEQSGDRFEMIRFSELEDSQ